MKKFNYFFIFATLLAGVTSASTVYAAAHTGAPMSMSGSKKEATSSASTDMTEGVIRKVDMDSKKITIKHGDIKNLDMTAMTMVFQVKNPAMLEQVKAGDTIRFKAEKLNGAIVVTDMKLVSAASR